MSSVLDARLAKESRLGRGSVDVAMKEAAEAAKAKDDEGLFAAEKSAAKVSMEESFGKALVNAGGSEDEQMAWLHAKLMGMEAKQTPRSPEVSAPESSTEEVPANGGTSNAASTSRSSADKSAEHENPPQGGETSEAGIEGNDSSLSG